MGPAATVAGGRDESLHAAAVEPSGWLCIFCTTGNALGSTRCGHCGLSRHGGTSRDLEQATRRWWQVGLCGRPLAAPVEAATAAGLFLLWRLADAISGHRLGPAVARGARLWRLERALGLPSESSLQHALSGGLLAHLLDAYYVLGHLPLCLVVGVLLFRRQPALYRRWRLALVTSTGVAFLIQLWAVAPPRLVPGLGIADTARSHGESLYAGTSAVANQLSSFPSVHVVWAVLIALVATGCSSRRLRAAGLMHGLVTVIVVVGTGNHYWLDAGAAAVLAVCCWSLTMRLRPAGDHGPAHPNG